MNVHALFDSPVVYRLGWCLLHSAWQGAVVAAMLAVVFRLLARRSAQARYLAACIAMTAMLAAGVVTFLVVPPSQTTVAKATRIDDSARGAVHQESRPVGDRGAIPLSRKHAPFARAGHDDIETTPAGPVERAQPAGSMQTVSTVSSLPTRIARFAEPSLPWLVAAWLAGVGALGLWRLGGLIAAWRLTKTGTQPAPPSIEELVKRLTRKLGVRRAARVLQSLVVETPMVVGWLRPVILLPLSAITGLSGSQLEAILAHEMAHIRRHDYLLNLLQSAVETLLFYHPAVWWISRRLRVERERCCDDVAVQLCGDRIGYAEALAAVETTRAAAFAAVAAGSPGGRDLINRIRRILGPSDHAAGPFLPSLMVALSVALFLLATVAASVLAQSNGKAAEAEPLKPVSGADQLATMIKMNLPGYKLRLGVKAGGSNVIDTLTTPDGKQEINLTSARGQWLGTVHEAPPANADRRLYAEPSYFWRNRTLTELAPKLKLKIESAAVAEDIARIVQGLFKSPALLESWIVKAEPMEGGWRVTPTYNGPLAQVQAQHPIELIVEDGVLKDVRENAGFWPLPSKGGSHPAAKANEPGWGQVVNGLAIRLQADEPVLYLAQGGCLRLSVRNLSPAPAAVPESQELGELEMDGTWYTFSYQHTGRYYVARKRLPAGQQIDDIAVTLTGDWERNGTAIRSTAGKHTFRFALKATPQGPNPAPAVRAVSNAVEVEFRWGVSSSATNDIDPAEVRRKIAALALPDETLPQDEQAVNWLSARRERIVPQLIAALDDKSAKIAEQCMDILSSVPANKEMADALVTKAGEATGLLRYKILRKLELSAADPRVVSLLDQASTEATTFAEPVVRARWAALAGRKDRAVEILKPLLDKLDESAWETTEGVRLLGEIGTQAGIELLERIAAGNHWTLACEAYKALAKADPKNHGLTKDQTTLLDQFHGFKEGTEDQRRRMIKLAKTLRASEIRPLVMQMLGDDQLPALFILAAWKDKEALPRIRELMRNGTPFVRQEAVAAYLSIANDSQAERDVMALLKEGDTHSNGGPSGPLLAPQLTPFEDDEPVLRGIVAAAVPAERRVAMLGVAAVTQKDPLVVPNAVQYEWYRRNGDEDVGKVLLLLMEKETDLRALGRYCQIAAADSQKRFADQIRRAMKLLAGDPSVIAEDAANAEAGSQILIAAAAYHLQDLAPEVQKLMRSASAPIHNAAQAAAAKLGLAGAVSDLYAQLQSEEAGVRQQAAAALLSIKPGDETERTAREEAVLSCVGKPCEDFALRVLATCGGEKSVKALQSILDDADPQRAVYAAWVMAQLPDKAAATRGMRRLAIFALLHHNVYQQGAGIDFDIGPNLRFHQVTERLNPDPRAYASGEGPLRIPDDLLQLFDWDEAEQRFAVRCYPLVNRCGDLAMAPVHFLDISDRSWTSRGGTLTLNRTHLPLLEEIAARDTRIDKVMVQGNAVAHFKYRQLAAQRIAAITGKKATYIALAGETIPSDAFPQPYKDQGKLLAKIVFDRIKKWSFRGRPATGADWQEAEAVRGMLNNLRWLFDRQVDDVIRGQAEQRGLDLQMLGVPDRSFLGYREKLESQEEAVPKQKVGPRTDPPLGLSAPSPPQSTKPP